MHITLTGNLGSGKSTVSKILKEKCGYEIYSTGSAQRKIAEELGIDVIKMNDLMNKDEKYDKMIDETTAKFSRENKDKDIIFDSRLAWNFVDESFKVFLSVNIDEAARRVYSDAKRGEVESYGSIDECKAKLIERAGKEDRRYQEKYNVHYFDFNNYNLVIDSTACEPECIAGTIEKLAGDSEGKPEEKMILFSPERLGIKRANKAEIRDFYRGGEVVIKASGDDYVIEEGMGNAVKAAEEGFCFVRCRLA